MRRYRYGVYCTSYCNKGHRLVNGAPVGHECYVLPPAALRAEAWDGDIEKAIAIIQAAKPMKILDATPKSRKRRP